MDEFISYFDFMMMDAKYAELVRQLPPHLGSLMPTLSKFLSPANFIKFDPAIDAAELSITGAKRWQMLLSPHALTLLRAYAVQRLPAND